MRRGIYKSTMRRDHPRRPKDTENGVPTPPPAAEQNGGGTPDKKVSSSARPLVNHTIYVDRQVARHASSRSKRKQIRRLTILAVLLAVGLAAAATGWMTTWMMLQDERDASAGIRQDLNKSQRSVEETQSHLKKLEDTLAELVEGRLPGAHLLEYNKMLDVNDEYVLNVTFSESGVKESKAVEYHALLVNNTSEMLLPRVKIFLFDDLGLQVGAVALDREQATNEAALPDLEPGETRSYHSRIKVERGTAPRYYAIYVE